MPSPPRRKSPSPAALGTHLEWHGRSIRVRVKVPPSRRDAVGKAWLKETLPTNDPREAELLKWPVIGRLKNAIARVKTEDDRTNRDREALAWREAIDHEARQLEAEGIEPWRATLPLALADKAEQIEATEGEAVARAFVDVASGTATPLETLVDDWLKEREVSGRTEQAFRYAVKQLVAWCGDSEVPQTVQAIDRRAAGRFVQERFINQGTDPGTANKTVTGLKSYWTWLIKRGHIESDGKRDAPNPWQGQRLGKKKKRRGENGEPSKRPFTDAEVATLITGTAHKQRLGDFVVIAALTGMRRDEIANLRVKHVADGMIRVLGTKTDAALRDVPVHPDLVDLFKRRAGGKSANDFIFDELPEQTSDARGRGAPITQEFTRDRRELGVEDKEEGARQSRIDLHSFRRWFIKKAVAALEDGATGFTAWTIADVVGHSKDDGPLPMTMGRYPGRADVKALRACVDSVNLPVSEG